MTPKILSRCKRKSTLPKVERSDTLSYFVYVIVALQGQKHNGAGVEVADGGVTRRNGIKPLYKANKIH